MDKYVPPFTISNRMLELVGNIMEKVGKLDNFSNLNKMPVLRRNNRIHSIHSSLAIEANSLSFNQVKDVINGNPEKDRKPITTFINEVNMYPGLLDIIINIEGLVNKRGIHASGVILYGDDPFDTASFMKAPNGELITCYDLHKAEAAGDTKYDFLVTEVSDKIIKCFELLAKDKVIEDMGLRDTYNKYIHPEIIDTTQQDIWDHLAAGDILDVFQFNSGVGLAIAKKLKPQNPLEMTAANAMMRLMSEKGVESQQDRYARIKDTGI